MSNNTTITPERQTFDTLIAGESVVLIESYKGLPAGTVIERRQYSWALELPSRKGYKSCGVTLDLAIEHALEGHAALEIATHNAIAGVLV